MNKDSKIADVMHVFRNDFPTSILSQFCQNDNDIINFFDDVEFSFYDGEEEFFIRNNKGEIFAHLEICPYTIRIKFSYFDNSDTVRLFAVSNFAYGTISAEG